MSPDKSEYLKPETVVLGQDGSVLARIDALFWPPIGATIRLGTPGREAEVRDVRLELHTVHAVACVTVGGAIAGGEE